jgi:Cys-tRNA(Pro) deacylase
MTKRKEPVTAAVRFLRAAAVEFQGHPYDYVDGGGTHQFALQAGVDEHAVVKTLIMEDDAASPLIVLMHGDREVSTRALARLTGAKSIHPCEPAKAQRHSGYRVGGTSPFATRRPMPVYCEASIAELPVIYINGGKRGYIISLRPKDMLELLKPTLVHAAR